jgi:hypothetical protein
VNILDTDALSHHMKRNAIGLAIEAQMRATAEEGIRHAKGKITLKATTLERPSVFEAGPGLQAPFPIRPDDSPQSHREHREDIKQTEETGSDRSTGNSSVRRRPPGP